MKIVVLIEALMQTMLVQNTKIKQSTQRSQGFNMVWPTMSTFIGERESFHYTIKNITMNRTRYNY